MTLFSVFSALMWREEASVGETKTAKEKTRNQSYRWQNLRLGDDAVGKAVLPALSGHLCPGDLEPSDPLVGRHPGHSPQEAAGDVALTDGEGGCQVLRLGQNLRVRGSWEKSREGGAV